MEVACCLEVTCCLQLWSCREVLVLDVTSNRKGLGFNPEVVHRN